MSIVHKVTARGYAERPERGVTTTIGDYPLGESVCRAASVVQNRSALPQRKYSSNKWGCTSVHSCFWVMVNDALHLHYMFPFQDVLFRQTTPASELADHASTSAAMRGRYGSFPHSRPLLHCGASRCLGDPQIEPVGSSKHFTRT